MFREKLMRIFYNKYGNDNLNIALLGASFVLAFINLFFRFSLIFILQTLCLVFFFIRFFSSNHQARINENNKFMIFVSKFKKSRNYNTFYTNTYSQPKDVGYKYFKCKTCSAKLRVPKKKGKITITCPKCRTSFKGKS